MLLGKLASGFPVVRYSPLVFYTRIISLQKRFIVGGQILRKPTLAPLGGRNSFLIEFILLVIRQYPLTLAELRRE